LNDSLSLVFFFIFLSSSSSKHTIPLLLPSYLMVTEDSSQSEPLSQLTQDLDLMDPDSSQTNHTHNNYGEGGDGSVIEDAGLASQMERMKQRVEQLEKEKMHLSMAKAPLEARFRQKEDMWEKEKTSLIDQIESSKSSLREADEKYRDLLVQYEQVFEEVSHLRLEVRKASSTARVASQGGGNATTATGTNNSLWDRQLQNDRDLAETKEKLRTAEEEIGAIRLAKVSLEKELHATRIELTCLERNYDELKAEYDEIAAHTSENNEAEIKLQVLTEEHIATTAALNAVYADLDATKARSDAAMKERDEKHKKEIEQLQFDLSVVKTRANKMQVDLDTSRDLTDGDVEDEAVLRARIEDRDKRIAKLEAELLNGEQLRRQMHNTIQELRGNIRVYVRTRPFLPGDKQSDDSPIDVTPDGESLSIIDRRSGSPMDFKFDKVFPPSAGQELVFDEVSDFVQSALDGYHVCLFSYGQTGSGKTHTMQGCGHGPMRGIIPRAVEKILDQARALNQHKWNFTVTASFLEIYNENLKDLLTSMLNDKGNNSGRAVKSNDKMAIKRDRDGKSFVDGLTHIPIDVNESSVGMEQLQALMNVASRSRSVASTKMNSQSSRSHSVFMLHLNGYNDETGAIVNGALNLCDLAGSERLDRSGAGADAQRLKETQSINKSLSCLGDVFNALATGASHVPYRNSKLTYLLQDCLSGDGKALMFVNLSPTTASCGESVCSLRFAQRVNKVELGKATKHIEYSSKK
jgi:kinesin family member C1